jgi:hypothetical protein
MAFSLSAHNLRSLRSYADCELFFNNTDAIRGYDKSTHGVPLHKERRDHHHKSLIRRMDGVQRGSFAYHPTYALRLYRTDVVTYNADGSILLDLSYASQSTAEFANRYTPDAHGYRRYYVSIRKDNLILRDKETHADYIQKHSSVPILIQADGTIDLSSVATTYTTLLNKPKAHTLRKALAPMVQYIKVLRSNGFGDNLLAHEREHMTNKFATTTYPHWNALIRFLVWPSNRITFPTNPLDITSMLATASEDETAALYYAVACAMAYRDDPKKEIYETAYKLSGLYEKHPNPVGTIPAKFTL